MFPTTLNLLFIEQAIKWRLFFWENWTFSQRTSLYRVFFCDFFEFTTFSVTMRIKFDDKISKFVEKYLNKVLVWWQFSRFYYLFLWRNRSKIERSFVETWLKRMENIEWKEKVLGKIIILSADVYWKSGVLYSIWRHWFNSRWMESPSLTLHF